jgi:hypothetical protein
MNDVMRRQQAFTSAVISASDEYRWKADSDPLMFSLRVELRSPGRTCSSWSLAESRRAFLTLRYRYTSRHWSSLKRGFGGPDVINSVVAR